MRLGRCLLVLTLSAVVACGGEATPGSTGPPSSRPIPVPATTTPVTTSPVTTTPVTTSPVTTTPVTTSPVTPPDSSVVEPTSPTWSAETVLGAPNPELLTAEPPEEIDWANVGAGWLLVDHPTGYGPFSDPVTLDRRGLYLVAPDDRVFGVTALPSDGSWVVAVSDDAQQILLQTFDPVCADGCTCSGEPLSSVETDVAGDLVQREFGYVLVDARARTVRPVIEPVERPVCGPGGFRRDVAFTRDGAGIWVTESWFTDDGRHVIRVRLSRVELDSGAWTSIVDRSFDPVDVSAATSPSLWEISVVDLDDDRIAVGTPEGTWLATTDGEPIRQLVDTGTPCHLIDTWDDGHVLARCVVPPGTAPPPTGITAEQCRPAGLWLVAIDGSPARQLAVRVHDGVLECWASYTSAIPLDGGLALQVGGDGATDGVDLIGPSGEVASWMPPDMEGSFTESLLGVRGDAWVIRSATERGDTGVYEVTLDSSARIDVLPGQVTVL